MVNANEQKNLLNRQICSCNPGLQYRVVRTCLTASLLYMFQFVNHSALVNDERIQNMDHLCGPSPWTSSWTRSMDYPRGPPLSFEGEFLPEV